MQVDNHIPLAFKSQDELQSQVAVLFPPISLSYATEQTLLANECLFQANFPPCLPTSPTLQQLQNSFLNETKPSNCIGLQSPEQLAPHFPASSFIVNTNEMTTATHSNSPIETTLQCVNFSNPMSSDLLTQPQIQQSTLPPEDFSNSKESCYQQLHTTSTEFTHRDIEENVVFERFYKLYERLIKLQECSSGEECQHNNVRHTNVIESTKNDVVESHQNNASTSTVIKGPTLPMSLLNDLCSEILKLRNQKLLFQISTNELMTLIQILHAHVKQCQSINFKPLFEQGKNVVNSNEYRTVLIGLEAATIILNVIIVNDAPKSIISEEAIEDIIALCKSQMRGIIFPIYDPSYQEEETLQQQDLNNNAKDDIATEDQPAEDEEAIEELEKVPKKRIFLKKENASRVKHEQPIVLLNKLIEVLNALNQLVSGHILPDTLILDLTNLTLPAFFVDGVPSLQLSVFALIRTIFSRYSQHRTLILEEIFCNLTKLPKSKRNLRTYRLVEQKKSIQMVSALLLQLIQCCTALPPPTCKSDDQQQKVLFEENQTSQNSYTSAIKCASSFCHTLLKYCSLKSKENEYRQILQNLVEDLLITLNLPEWPASEVLLLLLTKAFVHTLLTLKKSDKKENVSLEDETKKGPKKTMKDDSQEMLVTMSIQLLGMIAARLRQDIILVEQGAIFYAPPPRKIPESDNDQEDFSCICGMGYGERFMLDCDDCHRWFHGECVGIDPSTTPAIWYCDQCLLRRQLQQHKQMVVERNDTALKGSCHDNLTRTLLSPTRKKRKIADDLVLDVQLDDTDFQEIKDTSTQNGSTNIKEEDHIPVIKQLILNYLLHKSRVDPSALYARQFFLSQWNYEDDDKDNEEYYRAQWSIVNDNSLTNHGAPALSHDGTRKILVHLVANRDLLKSFPRLLNEILCVLNESQTRYRSRAIRALSTIVESDPNILGWPKVQASVKSRLYDQAISVREATVDLVGRYILYRPEFASHYFEYLAERLEDIGLSVRKRVVKISQSICWLQPTSSLTSNILVQLASRMNDEEVVKELVMKTFKDLWFTNDQSKLLKYDISDSQLIIDPLLKEQKNIQSSYDIRTKVKQILEVISCSTTGNNEWFVELVQGLLKSKDNESSKQQGKDVYRICEQMCQCLVESLLQIDEGNLSTSPIKVPPLTTATSHSKIEKKKPSKVESIFILLNLFCKVSPHLLVSHAETLQPYLKTQREEDARVHQEVAGILEQVIPLIEPPDYQFIQSVLNDLRNLIHTSLTPVVQVCMKSLCTIAKFVHNFSLLDQLYNGFFNFLEALKSDSTPGPKQKIFAIRSLYALGLLCKYFDFDQDMAKNRFLSTNKKIVYGPRVEKLYQIYTKFWNHEDLELKIAALKGLGCIMASYPGLFIRAESIVSEALNVSSAARLKMAAIKIFSEFLDYEEQKMEELGEKSAMQTSKDKNEVKENADYGITAAIVQKHLKPILEHMFDRDINVRLHALNLIHQIVRRSLVHPIQCVPHLIALETERNIALSEKAHRALQIIEEKHPTMIHNRISEGLLLSFTFQSKVFGSSRAIRVTQSKEGNSLKESTLGRLYSLFSGSKTGRTVFLSSVIHLYETNETNEQFLKYLTLATAALPFTLQEEPLYLIYHINRVTSFRGAQLLVSLKQKLNNYHEQTDIINEELSKECKAMICVILLLRLKKFLKYFYGLSDNKIQQFHPQDTKFCPLNNKVPIESADFRTLLPIEVIKEGNWEHNSDLCQQVFDIFKQELKKDEFNHSTLPYYSVARDRKTKKRRISLPQTEETEENGTSKQKMKRPLKRRRLSQNDDPDADYVPSS